ncbi:hypothetical protein J6590_062342 [Homalodisca vitripennis]|nr:hypothetical protein J6590_062342 [Homalodisca vitripennis]
MTLGCTVVTRRFPRSNLAKLGRTERNTRTLLIPRVVSLTRRSPRSDLAKLGRTERNARTLLIPRLVSRRFVTARVAVDFYTISRTSVNRASLNRDSGLTEAVLGRFFLFKKQKKHAQTTYSNERLGAPFIAIRTLACNALKLLYSKLLATVVFPRPNICVA